MAVSWPMPVHHGRAEVRVVLRWRRPDRMAATPRRQIQVTTT